MDPFVTLTAAGVPFDATNIDTDCIIPGRFLRKRRSSGYGNWLFYDLRFDAQGSPRTDFILNQPAYAGAQILVAAENFGCGSSREGAVWALAGYGLKVFIAPGFGDIFFSNAFKNGTLPIVVPSAVAQKLRRQLHDNPGARMTVDLEEQTFLGPDGVSYTFDVDPFRKRMLLTGTDEIGLTLQLADEIAAYETARRQTLPWLVPREHETSRGENP